MEKILLVGSGGREHALAKALVEPGGVKLFAAMDEFNLGISGFAHKTLDTTTDKQRIVAFCREHQIDFCVLGSDQVLATGLTDVLEEAGFPCASPSLAAAEIETDKTFMRSLLDKYHIAGQIDYCQTQSATEAVAFAESRDWQVAVKPIGLTSGKGVRVWSDHLSTAGDVSTYISEILDRGISGHKEVVVEELLRGEEFTLHFFCDGVTAVPTPPVQDHKRALDGDIGPNTGGMGSYSCAEGLLPFMTESDYKEACEIGQSVVDAMAREGRPFKGTLYGQYMVTGNGPKVIEFNARFGDPEAINALGRLETPYVDICRATIDTKLHSMSILHRDIATLASYVAPAGYPDSPEVGGLLEINTKEIEALNAQIYYRSCELVSRDNDVIVVKMLGARAIGIYTEGPTSMAARETALQAFASLEGNFFYRSDIGSAESLGAKAARLMQLRGS